MSRFTIARALYESEYEALKLRTRIETLEEENNDLRQSIENLKKIKMGDATDFMMDCVPNMSRRWK